MPLDIIGPVAVSGSSGANARNTARVNDQTSAAASARDAAVSAFSESAPREEVQVSSPSANLAVFVSPFIRFDITARLAIVEIRNSETGEVQQQYPSPKAVREYTQNLPETSDLRQNSTEPRPRIIGSAEDRATSAPAPTAAAPAPQAVAASAAAFSSLQGVPTGSKQVAEA